MTEDMTTKGVARHDWQAQELAALYDMPLMDLLYRAQSVHRTHFDPNRVQLSTLLSIKTGLCPEDCAYCPQSAHYNTGVEKVKLMPVATVVGKAEQAKAAGATRFCMGAAWRHLGKRELDHICDMVRGVKATGLETCMTLGMLTEEQAQALSDAGLDYYNHNLDSSPEYYAKIITTRTYEDRLNTLKNVRKAGMKVCCGGIIGMGESRQDRIGLLRQLAALDPHPESVPINLLMRVKGTPLADCEGIDRFEFVRTVAVARIALPTTVVRLSAGRTQMSEEMQALCFFAGANSIFYAEDKLLTTPNPEAQDDNRLFAKLGLQSMRPVQHEARLS